jgi:hypothetical protein
VHYNNGQVSRSSKNLPVDTLACGVLLVPNFVLLRHTMPLGSERPSHFDLMLEDAGVLRTWAMEAEPSLYQTLVATQLPDHRLAYLEYEGEISSDRGSVLRSDSGTYRTLDKSPGRWEIQIAGTRLRGRLLLEQQADQRWTLSLSTAADFSEGASSS